MRYTSAERAQNFVNRGLAEMVGGKLRFYSSTQERNEELEFARNRGGMYYWNGARSVYIEGRNVAMFPPGCNVSFPKAWSKRALQRYTSLPAGQGRGAEMRPGRRVN